MKTAVSAWYLRCPSCSSSPERWRALHVCCFALVVSRSGSGPQPSLQIAQFWETVFWWCLTITSGLTFWLWMNLSVPTRYLYANRAQTRICAQTKNTSGLNHCLQNCHFLGFSKWADEVLKSFWVWMGCLQGTRSNTCCSECWQSSQMSSPKCPIDLRLGGCWQGMAWWGWPSWDPSSCLSWAGLFCSLLKFVSFCVRVMWNMLLYLWCESCFGAMQSYAYASFISQLLFHGLDSANCFLTN